MEYEVHAQVQKWSLSWFQTFVILAAIEYDRLPVVDRLHYKMKTPPHDCLSSQTKQS
jgi:hypothetical protein